MGVPSARLLALVLIAALAGAACNGTLTPRYEYEEELYLGVDGTATLHVNASIASLVALHGADLDPDPRSRPDRARIRELFAGPGAVVSTPTFFRRHGRRFTHVRVTVPSVVALRRVRPLSWSIYRFQSRGDSLVFEQDVGKPLVATTFRDPAWTGNELIAFRMHVPSEVLFENATTDVQRGNIVAWEQRLSERLTGAPLALRVEMAPESILYSTLILFGATILAAAMVFAAAIWWIVRRGRAELAAQKT
jgi:hypothetical protein